ncbi:MAG: histidine kinase [Eubacterium sp.]|nr:histidine kinase [Eubacterium sp.]
MKNNFLVRFYRNLRLQSKMNLIILIAVAIPMVTVTLFLMTRMYRMITAEALRNEQIAAAEASPVIRSDIRSVIDATDSLQSLYNYQLLFRSTLYGEPESTLDTINTESFQQSIADTLAGTAVDQVRFYVDLDASAECFSEENAEVFQPLSSITSTYWYGIFYGSHPSSLFCPRFYLSDREVHELGDCAYIRPLYIRTMSGLSVRAYMAAYFSSEILEQTMIDNLSAQGSVSYITSSRDAVVTSTDKSLSGRYYVTYDDIRTNLMTSNGFISRTFGDEEVYMSCYYLPEADWFLVTVTPSMPLRKATVKLWGQILLMWALAVAGGLVISSFLSHSLSRRISRVSDRMSLVRNAAPVPMESADANDEIGDLTDSYNYMARQINLLMDDQRRSSEELRIAEFKSLQAQINPHFLYNTMEMINWMAQQGRTKETNAAIRDLSSFYRLTLSRKTPISTLEEELEHVSTYVRLQNMRFENGIDFVVDIPESMYEYRIPRLTFQPVVENAILHGILEKESHRGTIVLTGWVENGTVVILISDDGVGIPPDKLRDILRKKTDSSDSSGKGNHIAIYNTHRRLQILFGSEYGLHYSSERGKGTEVEIRLPAFTEDTPLEPRESAKDLPGMAARANSEIVRKKFEIQKLHELSDDLSKNEQIYILTHTIDGTYPEHSHDYWELNYVCRGTFSDIVNGYSYSLKPGDLLIINKKSRHSLECRDEDNLIINICVNADFASHTLAKQLGGNDRVAAMLHDRGPLDIPCLYYPSGHIVRAQSVIADLIEQYAEAGFHDSEEVERLIVRLFETLSEAEPGADPEEYRRQYV